MTLYEAKLANICWTSSDMLAEFSRFGATPKFSGPSVG